MSNLREVYFSSSLKQHGCWTRQTSWLACKLSSILYGLKSTITNLTKSINKYHTEAILQFQSQTSRMSDTSNKLIGIYNLFPYWIGSIGLFQYSNRFGSMSDSVPYRLHGARNCIGPGSIWNQALYWTCFWWNYFATMYTSLDICYFISTSG